MVLCTLAVGVLESCDIEYDALAKIIGEHPVRQDSIA